MKEGIPSFLLGRDRWILWRYAERGGKVTKVPCRTDGGPARVNDPSTWCSYSAALSALARGGFDGLGVVLGDGLVGIDLDWKGWTGEGIPPEAQKILDRFTTYAELSPSGKGAHILMEGRLPEKVAHRKRLADGVEIEVYDEGRFFTFTGQRLNDYEITPQQAELEALLNELGMLKPKRESPPPPPVGLDDEALLQRMFSSKAGPKIRRLWEGDWTGYPSPSEADQALANHLVWWTNGNREQTLRLLYASGLYRPKWDERHTADGRTYAELTVDKALEGFCGGYDPHLGRRETGTVWKAKEPGTLKTPEEDWPEPEPLESLGEYPLREFPREVVLPPELEEYASALAERLSVPLGAIALPMLAVASTAIGGKAFIAPDPENASWIEPSNLWVVVIADVSTGKTAILNAVLRPLYELDREGRRRYQEELEQYERDLERWKAKRQGERPKKPVPSRLLATDITKEALAELLATNPAILSYHDEASGLFRLWQRDEKAAERSFYISAYNATPHTVDRIGRQASHLERPVLSLLGFIQPGPFSQLVKQALEDSVGADGLLQRFFLVWCETLPFKRERPRVDEEAVTAYTEAIKGLYESVRSWPEEMRVLHFDEEAQSLWYDWEAYVEEELRNPDHSRGWKGYLGKWKGLTARLALVLGLLHGEEEEISRISLQRAIATVLWGESHAKRVWMRSVQGDPTPVVKLARKIQAGELVRFTLREIYRRNLAGINTAAEAQRAVSILAEAGWVFRDPQNPHAWVANPKARAR